MEAMACGLPVVAFSVDGVPETVVDGQTGYLVVPGDAGGLAERLRGLLRDPQAIRTMGGAACRRVREHFTAQSTADKVAGVLEEVLPGDR
jgi:glycosyltransferase involved in cell wall biosynthesis